MNIRNSASAIWPGLSKKKKEKKVGTLTKAIDIDTSSYPLLWFRVHVDHILTEKKRTTTVVATAISGANVRSHCCKPQA